MRPFFQPAKLYAPNTGTWRISWYNVHPVTGELARVQKTFNLNRIGCPIERRIEATKYMKMLNEILRRGFNYFKDIQGLTEPGGEDGTNIYQLMHDMLPVRCAGKKPRTILSYSSYNNVFCQWLLDNKLADVKADKFSAGLFQKFINHKVQEGCGNRNINDYISFVKASYDKAIYLGLVDVNPLNKIQYLPDVESSRFEVLTADELQRVAACLKSKHMRYYIYTKFTAMEFIRPYHIAFIKSADIDYQNNTIRINADSSKNRKVKYKQLMPDVKALLLQHEYHLLPGHFYIFSKNFEPAQKLYPSLSKRSAEVWRQLVIKGLGIDKKMYALKHTAGQFYVNANDTIDAGWLQHHMEHSSLTETEAYIHKRKTKRLNMDDVKLIQY